MSSHPSFRRPGRSATRKVARRRLAMLGRVPALSDRQASAAEVLREQAAEDVEHPGVFDAAEVHRRAQRASLFGDPAVSAAALPGVGELPDLEPGPRLANLLGDLTADDGPGRRETAPSGLRSLSQFSLVEVAAAADRLASWAAAVQADALAALADRQTVPTLPAGVRASSISQESMAGRLVAARVCWSPLTGESRVREARRLRSELSATFAALRAGQICPRRARVIVDGTAALSPERARRVEAQVLPKAPRLTAAKLRQAVEKLVAADDRDGAEDRHAAALERRDVCSYPLPYGMAEIVATLSAEDAAAVMAALNAAAVAMKAADPDDPRTLAQRRADALAEIGWGALATGQLSPHPHTYAAEEPTACDETDAAPGGEADPAGGAEDPVGGHADPTRSAADSIRPATGVRANGCGCGGRRLARGRGDRPAAVSVTVPLSTLIGLDDQPAELAGHGPIPASVARRLAAHGTWRRLLTDPVSGAVLDCGTTRYRPPPDLVEVVHLRDRTCRWPGCHHPASRTQTDHVTPAAAGGSTSVNGLGPECWPCHLAKTHTGWDVEQPEPGRFEWIAPDGHRYTVEPEPVGPIIDPPRF
ncbi:MAG TPA: DUF222 domain-containing protein [Jiangellaceae bacterium]|nr:DUF222 domain-containing protein [Jiangellaceae bacterium]